ncbi:MAG TPA: aminoacyl-tRNA hydrolase [Candidatus Dormibacteraeota bacterium]|jgi:ribosome-associated protein|nr:aminoacyl-tRNA hydrolase [Candidatus Dormibacteraeota bacterium]
MTMDAEAAADQILKNALWRASRSSGPGGQRRDKVETRAELTVAEEHLEGLPEEVAARLRWGLRLEVEPLRLMSQESRFLTRNREIVAERLLELVREALAPPPPPRRPTRPSRGAEARRIAAKTRRGEVKSMRQAPRRDDG